MKRCRRVITSLQSSSPKLINHFSVEKQDRDQQNRQKDQATKLMPCARGHFFHNLVCESENNDASFEDECDDDVDNCGDEIRTPSSEEAQKAASLLRNYFYFKKDVDDHIFHYLSEIDCALARERKVQAKLTDYFSPL